MHMHAADYKIASLDHRAPGLRAAAGVNKGTRCRASCDIAGHGIRSSICTSWCKIKCEVQGKSHIISNSLGIFCDCLFVSLITYVVILLTSKSCQNPTREAFGCSISPPPFLSMTFPAYQIWDRTLTRRANQD